VAAAVTALAQNHVKTTDVRGHMGLGLEEAFVAYYHVTVFLEHTDTD
jgi:hypothetical protein